MKNTKSSNSRRNVVKKKSQFNVLPECSVISLNEKSLTNILLELYKHPFYISIVNKKTTSCVMIP